MTAKAITDFFESLNHNPYGSLINNLISTGIWAFLVFFVYKMFNGGKAVTKQFNKAIETIREKDKSYFKEAEILATARLELQLILIFVRQCAYYIVAQFTASIFMVANLILVFSGHLNVLVNSLLLIGMTILSFISRSHDNRIDAMIDGARKSGNTTKNLK